MGSTMVDTTQTNPVQPQAPAGVEALNPVVAAPPLTETPVVAPVAEMPAPVVPVEMPTPVPPSAEAPAQTPVVAPVEEDADPTGLVENGSQPETVPTPPQAAELPAAQGTDPMQENAADANPVQEARHAEELQAAAEQLKQVHALPGADERNASVGAPIPTPEAAPTDGSAVVAPANEPVTLEVASVEPGTATPEQLVTPQ